MGADFLKEGGCFRSIPEPLLSLRVKLVASAMPGSLPPDFATCSTSQRGGFSVRVTLSSLANTPKLQFSCL